MKKKIIIIRVIYILLFCVIMYVAGRTLKIWTGHGIQQAAAMYVQPRRTIDVAMMGQSHIHCDVDPYLLFDEYGIASYDMSAAEQPLWVTYYYIKEICKYQDPKVIVIDMYTPAALGDTFNDNWIGDNFFGIRFSLNKIDMMLHTCTFDQVNRFFPSFFGYHSDYSKIKPGDIPELVKRRPEVSFKGHTVYHGEIKYPVSTAYVEEIAEIPPKSRKYLEIILDYTRKHDIELFLVSAPHNTDAQKEMIYNGIGKWADENNVPYYNGNRNIEELGIDLQADFCDESHLNEKGARKYSRYLGKMLKEKYDLPDRRGDEKYSSWEKKEKE